MPTSAIYETILNEDGNDAEAYWSLVLCKYGIEYVEDPKTHGRTPTCHRTQLTSIFSDENYRQAIAKSEPDARAIYEAEAKAIDDIQKGILSISSKEEPFDVFICYKEQGEDGKRTRDSVLAQELHLELSKQGLKVFFARITLEDKLGSAYEPYIFAALQSSRVMVVLGTRTEYFNAVWVKNEWNRFLALIKDGAEKTLIPAYRDMDPYDLPDAFSHLQALDMSKLGFMQDLVGGIRKILQKRGQEPAAAVVAPSTTSSADPPVKRGFLFLEDRDFANANTYFEKALDADPENAKAYAGKVLAGNGASNFKEIREKTGTVEYVIKDVAANPEKALNKEYLASVAAYLMPLQNNDNFVKALRFADEKYRLELSAIRDEEIETAYSDACKVFQNICGNAEGSILSHVFTLLGDYKDARKKAEDSPKEGVYHAALGMVPDSTKYSSHAEKTRRYRIAAETFSSIPGYRDANEKRDECLKKADEHRKAANRTRMLIGGVIVALPILIISIFRISHSMSDYLRERNERRELNMYTDAIQEIGDGKYEEARDALLQLDDSDSARYEKYYPDVQYNLGVLYRDGKGASKDVMRANHFFMKGAMELYRKGEYAKALPFFTQAAEQDSAEAENYLGLMHLNALGVTKNYDEAFHHIGDADKSVFCRVQTQSPRDPQAAARLAASFVRPLVKESAFGCVPICVVGDPRLL